MRCVGCQTLMTERFLFTSTYWECPQCDGTPQRVTAPAPKIGEFRAYRPHTGKTGALTGYTAIRLKDLIAPACEPVDTHDPDPYLNISVFDAPKMEVGPVPGKYRVVQQAQALGAPFGPDASVRSLSADPMSCFVDVKERIVTLKKPGVFHVWLPKTKGTVWKLYVDFRAIIDIKVGSGGLMIVTLE